MTPADVRAVDCWVNPFTPEVASTQQPEFLVRVATDYMMTSAYLPKYLPPEMLQFMNTRGQDKILFATDFPFLPFDRAADSARALDLRPGVLEKYLRDNARRVFRFA